MQAGAIQYVLHDEFMPGTDLKLGGARAVALSEENSKYLRWHSNFP